MSFTKPEILHNERIALLSDKVWTTAAGNVYREFTQTSTCGFWDIRTVRQKNRDRHKFLSRLAFYAASSGMFVSFVDLLLKFSVTLNYLSIHLSIHPYTHRLIITSAIGSCMYCFDWRLSVCLSVCLFVNRMNTKVMGSFFTIFLERYNADQRRVNSILES